MQSSPIGKEYAVLGFQSSSDPLIPPSVRRMVHQNFFFIASRIELFAELLQSLFFGRFTANLPLLRASTYRFENSSFRCSHTLKDSFFFWMNARLMPSGFTPQATSAEVVTVERLPDIFVLKPFPYSTSQNSD